MPKPGIKKILVPLDFSENSLRALDYALMLAEPFGADVYFLRVVEPAGFRLEHLTIAAELEDQLQFHLRAERERLLDLQRRRVGRCHHGEVLVRIGRAWSEIPDTAQALGVDLVVLGARGEASSNLSLLGSTAEGVVRHARCPVLTVA